MFVYKVIIHIIEHIYPALHTEKICRVLYIVQH